MVECWIRDHLKLGVIDVWTDILRRPAFGMDAYDITSLSLLECYK